VNRHSLTKKTVIKGLKLLKSELLNYRREFIILIILAIASAIASGAIPFLVGRIIDNILNLNKTIFYFLLAWGLIKMFSNIIDWRTGIRREKLGILIEADYIAKGFAKLLDKPIAFHKEHKIGNVTHRIMRAGSSLERISSRIMISLMPQFLSIIVALVITFYVNPTLAFVLIVTAAAFVFILVKMIAPIVSLQNKMHKAYQNAYGDAFDAVYNTQTVKQAVAEDREKENLYKNFCKKAVKLYGELKTIWNNLDFSQRLLILTTQCIVFVYSVFAIRAGQMTIGELVMFNSYAAMVFGPFVVLGNNWQAVQRGIVALVQADSLLSAHPERYVPKNSIPLPDIKGNIKFKNVSFYYKKSTPILKKINFKIKPGQTIALVGESGVGKTTLVDLISGYHFPKSGKILIDNTNIKKINLKFLRSKISIVPQEVLLFNDTIKNNIKYGKFDASDREIENAAKAAFAHNFIKKFSKKYNQIVGERGIKLSSGQKQRIAIARAILHNPKILILDEPTSSLDARSEMLISKSLEKLMRGRTTVIIAHRLSTVRKADKIIVLDEGKIAEKGRHEELVNLKQGIYHRLYDLQFGVK